MAYTNPFKKPKLEDLKALGTKALDALNKPVQAGAAVGKMVARYANPVPGVIDLYNSSKRAQTQQRPSPSVTPQQAAQAVRSNPLTNKSLGLTNTVVGTSGQAQRRQLSPQDEFLQNRSSRNNQLASQRAAMLQNQSDRVNVLRNQMYDSKAAQLKEQLPGLKQSLNTSTQTINRAAEDYALQETERTGSTLRDMAQAKRETDALRQNTFANLGTVDSGGYYGFTGQQANADTAFLRQQSQAMQERDRSIREAKQNAQTAIQSEVSKYNELVANINNALYNNEQERAMDLQKAYNELENNLYGIQDWLTQQEDTADKFVMEMQMKDLESQKAKNISSTEAGNLGELTNSVTLIQNARNAFNTGNYDDIIGPVQGRVRKANPYDSRAQVFNSDMMALAQNIGKAMEGGVLRAEDVPKYRAILPNIEDTKETALGKMDSVERMLTDLYGNKVGSYSSAGYNVSGYNSRPTDNIVARLRAAGYSDQEIQEYLGGY